MPSPVSRRCIAVLPKDICDLINFLKSIGGVVVRLSHPYSRPPESWPESESAVVFPEVQGQSVRVQFPFDEAIIKEVDALAYSFKNHPDSVGILDMTFRGIKSDLLFFSLIECNYVQGLIPEVKQAWKETVQFIKKNYTRLKGIDGEPAFVGPHAMEWSKGDLAKFYIK